MAVEVGDRLTQNVRRRITTMIAVAAGDASDLGLARARERLTVLAPQGAATAELLGVLAQLAALTTPRCPRCWVASVGLCPECRPAHARELAGAYRVQAGALPPVDPAAGATQSDPPAPASTGALLDRIDREDLIAMCASKRRYVSQIDADKVARRCEAERPGTVLRSYSCPCCYGWHLTHKPLAPEPVR